MSAKGKCQPLPDFEASSVILFAALATGNAIGRHALLPEAAAAWADLAADAPQPVPATRTDVAAPTRPSAARPNRRRTPISSTAAIVVEQLESGQMDGFVPFDRRRRA